MIDLGLDLLVFSSVCQCGQAAMAVPVPWTVPDLCRCRDMNSPAKNIVSQSGCGKKMSPSLLCNK